MIPNVSVACALLLATAVLGRHTEIENVPANEVSPDSIEPVSRDGAEVGAIEGMVYPEEILEGEIDLTPEEAQLRRVRLGVMFSRFPFRRFRRGRLPRRRVIFPRRERVTTIVNVGEVVTNRPVLDEVLADEDADMILDEYADNENDISLDETGLARRSGRGGRGERGRTVEVVAEIVEKLVEVAEEIEVVVVIALVKLFTNEEANDSSYASNLILSDKSIKK
ncbi:hypothetical protein K7432_009613 [Basidiobolus ranarum]|uniref:Uncharacterized protein n=1 Tax=Basidiobolus ranarum TaxID=34480 RepID=A0ABR2WQ38_9FUNG